MVQIITSRLPLCDRQKTVNLTFIYRKNKTRALEIFLELLQFRSLGKKIESKKRFLFVGSEARTYNQLGLNISPNSISYFPYGARADRKSKPMLFHANERVCCMRPAHLKLYGCNNPEAPHRTSMAYFSKTPRWGFRVFDESEIVRPYKTRKLKYFASGTMDTTQRRTFQGHRLVVTVAQLITIRYIHGCHQI